MSTGKIDGTAAPKIYFSAVLAMLLLSVITALTKGDLQIFLSYALPQICYLGAIGIYLAVTKTPVRAAIPFRRPVKPLALLLTLAVTVGLFGQNLLLAVSVQWLVDAIGVPAEVTVPSLEGGVGIALGILILCVMPAFGEECMFRGIGVTSFKSRGNLKAALISALFFSLSHGNVVQLAHQFILGLVLAYLTLETGNILYAMLIHFFNNLLAILLPVVLPVYNGLAVCSAQNALIMLGLCVAGIAVLYPSLFLLVKAAGGERKSLKEFFRRNPAEVCYNSGIEDGGISKSREKAWLAGLLIFLVVQLAINTVLTAFPNLTSLIT